MSRDVLNPRNGHPRPTHGSASHGEGAIQNGDPLSPLNPTSQNAVQRRRLTVRMSSSPWQPMLELRRLCARSHRDEGRGLCLVWARAGPLNIHMLPNRPRTRKGRAQHKFLPIISNFSPTSTAFAMFDNPNGYQQRSGHSPVRPNPANIYMQDRTR